MTHHLQSTEYIISQLNGTNCLRQTSSLQNHADLEDLMPWDECSDLIGQTTHTDLNLVEFDAHEMQGLFDPMVLKYENDVTVTSERDTAAPDSQTHVSTTAPSPYPDFNQQMSPVSMQSYASSSPTVPSSTPYSGDYGFAVSVQKQQKETKSATWTHSETLGKLYVRLGVACPFVYRCGSSSTASKSGSCGRTTPAASSSGSAVGVHPPSGAIVRILPVYIRPEHVRDVVRRCPNHAAQAVNRASGDPQAISEAQHLIRSQTPKAVYVEDPCSRRLSVVIPYEQPQAGSEWVTTLLEFHCFSSCVGGLNRRPVQLIFTLEMPDGTVLGREAIEVRVCACPGRDRAGDERATLAPAPGDSYGSSSAIEKLTFDGTDSGKNSGGRHGGGANKRKLLQTAATVLHSGEHDLKRPRDEQDGEMFTLNVRGRKSYDILCTIRDCLELSAMLPSHLAEQYRSKHSQLSQSPMSYDSSPLSLVATPNCKATNLKVPVALSGVATSQTAARRPSAPIGIAGVTGLSSNAIFGLTADVQLTNGSPLFYR